MRDEKIDYSRKRSVYLDYAATPPTDPAVLGAWDKACRGVVGNPASLNVCGLDAWNLLEESRRMIAEYFLCSPGEIFFCGSGTEALAAGIGGIIGRFPGTPVITSCIEHAAVRHPLRLYELSGGRVRFVPVDSTGKLDPGETAAVVSASAAATAAGVVPAASPERRSPSALLILSPVHHETGAVQPVGEIMERVRKNTPGCVILIDAVQAASRISPAEWTHYCDMFAVSGHKIYTPQGIGFLKKSRYYGSGEGPCREPLRLKPLRFGGGQEGGLFPGTPNLPGAASLAAAVEILRNYREEESSRLQVLGNEGLEILSRTGVPFQVESPRDAAPGLLNISFPWADDMTRFFLELNRNLICTSRFSACSESVEGPSHVLTAMGVPEERASRSVRLSFGRFSKREDFFRLADILTMMYKRTGKPR